MNSDLWDEAEQSYQDKRSEAAFWTLPHDSTEKADQELVHRWLMNELEFLKHENRDRLQNVHKNLALYKGIQYRDTELRQGDREPNVKKKALEKIVLNYLFDLTKSRVSKLLKYKPGVAVLPTSDEWEDDISAKMVKAWLDHIWYVERFDGIKIPKFIRYTQPMGECYFYVDWDPFKGDVSKQYREALKASGKSGKVPLLDENGQQEQDDRGNPIWVDQPVYNGDVSYRIKMTTDCFPERVPSGEWEDVRYIFDREVMSVEEARLLYPKATQYIKSNKDAVIYDYEKLESRQDQHQVEVWTLNHKRTRAMDKGRKIVFTRDGILSNTKFPFSHRKLPCIRMTDTDVPGELHGRSFFDLVRGSTGAYNNLTNMIMRNQVFVGHPKWMLPAGSAKLDSLGNAITIVQFKGPIAPQLVSANPTPREIFEFRGMLKEEFMQQADVGMTGRGDPPPGITAAVALQYLSELENERWNEAVVKYNETVLQVAILSAAVAGDYYDDKDERLIRMLGKNNRWMSVAMNVANFQKDYDFRIQNSSALPESKAARTEYLLYLHEKFPDRVDADSVLNMLDLAQSEKFINTATVSVRAAETENEMLMDVQSKIEVNPPSEEEDQVEHWKIHVKQMREWSFKNRSPEIVQKRMKDHVLATEMLIAKKVLEIPGYDKVVAPIILMGFPLLLKTKPTVDIPPEEQPLMDQGLPQPYNAPIDGGDFAAPQEQAVQEPGMENNPEMPSIATQMNEAPVAPAIQPTQQI